MLPAGFLGTRADVLMDFVVVAFVLIVPALAYSWRLVRAGHYTQHKKLQLSLFSILAITVILFEIDMRLAGGIFEMTKDSRYAGTWLLNGSIWFHTVLAIFTSLLWIGLVLISRRRFPSPPEPGEFSVKHRFWGRIGMVAMALTGITGIELYIIGFMM